MIWRLERKDTLGKKERGCVCAEGKRVGIVKGGKWLVFKF